MRQAAKRTRENRTITVDFRDDATYLQLLDNGKAFVEFVGAFLLSLGFQLAHKATCRGGGCLTCHSHYVRLRVRGITIWRIQCTTCRPKPNIRVTRGNKERTSPHAPGSLLVSSSLLERLRVSQ